MRSTASASRPARAAPPLCTPRAGPHCAGCWAARRLAHGEWGLTVPGEQLDGEPLDVGLRLADGLLRAQAVALHGAGELDPWQLLWWNRQTRLVRFGCTRSRDIWIHADLPAPGVDERALDR